MKHRKDAFRLALIVILAWAIVWLATQHFSSTGA
jgi:hypothetical protein